MLLRKLAEQGGEPLVNVGKSFDPFLPQPCLEQSPECLDRVEMRRVGGQEDQANRVVFQPFLDGTRMMNLEVVEDQDLIRSQLRPEDLQPFNEAFLVQSTRKALWCKDLIVPQRSDQSFSFGASRVLVTLSLLAAWSPCP